MKSAIVYTPKGSKTIDTSLFKAGVKIVRGSGTVRRQAAYRFLRQRCGYSKSAAHAAVKG